MSGQSTYAPGRSQSIAIAGASGDVGQHLVEETLKAGLKVTALLRKENARFVERMSPLGALSVEVLDLSSADAIRTVLLKHSVDTVVCVYALAPADWRVQIAMVDAAEAAGVRRFAPTSCTFPCDRAWPNGWNKAEIETEKRLKTTEMQWTKFTCGIFMNYFGHGSPDPTAMGYLKSDEPFIVDGVKGTAELPGTGDDPLAFTELSDVGRGVAHACLSDADWTCETGYMVGERLTYNEALRMLEEASGRKMHLTYISVPALKERIARADDEYAKWFDEILLKITEGLYVYDDSLGQISVGEPPQVWKGKTLRECLQQWWGRAPQ